MRARSTVTDSCEILDITVPMRHGMRVWPGDPPVQFDAWGEGSVLSTPRVTRVSFGTHTGAHVDAPAHVIVRGATIDQLPLTTMVGPCFVAETAAWPAISERDLASLGVPPDCRRLLIRTRASHEFQAAATTVEAANAGLTPCAADWLIARGITLVGIDCPSIEPVEVTQPGDGLPAHHKLLAAGIIIVEGLSLLEASAGAYLLACLPLKLEGLDGAPVRAVLLRQHTSSCAGA